MESPDLRRLEALAALKALEESSAWPPRLLRRLAPVANAAAPVLLAAAALEAGAARPWQAMRLPKMRATGRPRTVVREKERP